MRANKWCHCCSVLSLCLKVFKSSSRPVRLFFAGITSRCSISSVRLSCFVKSSGVVWKAYWNNLSCLNATVYLNCFGGCAVLCSRRQKWFMTPDGFYSVQTLMNITFHRCWKSMSVPFVAIFMNRNITHLLAQRMWAVADTFFGPWCLVILR